MLLINQALHVRLKYELLSVKLPSSMDEDEIGTNELTPEEMISDFLKQSFGTFSNKKQCDVMKLCNMLIKTMLIL